MKKLFSKIDNSSKDPNCFVGKQFVVGRTSVTVEDVIAEGKFEVKYCTIIPIMHYLRDIFHNCRWICCCFSREKQ